MNKSRPLVSELLYQLMLMAGIPIFVTVGLFFWQLYPQLTGNISQEQQSIATLAAEQTQQRIRTAEQQVLFFLELARENRSLGIKKNVSSLLSGFVKQNSYFDTLYLLDTKGVIKQIAIRRQRPPTGFILASTPHNLLYSNPKKRAAMNVGLRYYYPSSLAVSQLRLWCLTLTAHWSQNSPLTVFRSSAKNSLLRD